MGESGTRTRGTNERDGARAAGSRKRPTGPHYHKSGRFWALCYDRRRSLTRVTDTGQTGMGRSHSHGMEFFLEPRSVKFP
eukprot:scaffold117147_cov66-Attheya_sp.AAC.1